MTTLYDIMRKKLEDALAPNGALQKSFHISDRKAFETRLHEFGVASKLKPEHLRSLKASAHLEFKVTPYFMGVMNTVEGFANFFENVCIASPYSPSATQAINSIINATVSRGTAYSAAEDQALGLMDSAISYFKTRNRGAGQSRTFP